MGEDHAASLTKFSLLQRRADITRAGFVQHWRTVHVDVLVNMAGHKTYNQSYVQNEFQTLPGIDDQRFDGAAQMVPRSPEVVQRGFQDDPLYKSHVRPDEQLFLNVAGCTVLYCETTTVGSAVPADASAKALVLVRCRPGENRSSFLEAWKHHAQQLVASSTVNGVLGMRQHWVVPGAARCMLDGSTWAEAPDVVDEMFFGSLDALAFFCRSDAFTEGFAKFHALAPGQGSHLFAARAHLVYDGK